MWCKKKRSPDVAADRLFTLNIMQRMISFGGQKMAMTFCNEGVMHRQHRWSEKEILTPWHSGSIIQTVVTLATVTSTAVYNIVYARFYMIYYILYGFRLLLFINTNIMHYATSIKNNLNWKQLFPVIQVKTFIDFIPETSQPIQLLI